MHYITRYAAVAAPFLIASCGLSAIGFSLAGEMFAPVSTQGKTEVVAETQTTNRPVTGSPSSALLGGNPVVVAKLKARRKREGEWVQVVDAVNMRKGPSSSRPVIKVQVTGNKLRVASREGKWVEVVEPKTGRTGWVFGNYVKRIESVSRRADASDTTLR